jgi:hypothetical protein
MYDTRFMDSLEEGGGGDPAFTDRLGAIDLHVVDQRVQL